MKEYKQYNDYELLYMVRENNEDAFSVLYEKYQPLMQKYAQQYYHYYKNEGIDYDDLCQEAYLAFDRCLRYYQEGNETLFYTFLCITIRSRLLNYIKGLSSKKNRFFRDCLSLDQIYGDSDLCLGDFVSDPKDMTLLDQLSLNSSLLKVHQFCIDLEFELSQIFELYWNGFSIMEISTLLALDSSKVSLTLRKIRKSLRQYLSD